jgi:hypothetical protein
VLPYRDVADEAESAAAAELVAVVAGCPTQALLEWG